MSLDKLKFTPKTLRNNFSKVSRDALSPLNIMDLLAVLTMYDYPKPPLSFGDLKSSLLAHGMTNNDLQDITNHFSTLLDQKINCFRHNNPYFERNLISVAKENEKISGILGLSIEMLTDDCYKDMGFEAYSTAHIEWMLQATGWIPNTYIDEIDGLEIERCLLWEPPYTQ